MSGAKTEYMLNSLGAVEKVSDDEVAAARRTVARHAADAQDCRDLLDMLGLLGEGVET